jgi:hypothetical protein
MFRFERGDSVDDKIQFGQRRPNDKHCRQRHKDHGCSDCQPGHKAEAEIKQERATHRQQQAGKEIKGQSSHIDSHVIHAVAV